MMLHEFQYVRISFCAIGKAKATIMPTQKFEKWGNFAQIVGFHKSGYIIIICVYNYRLCGMKPLDGQLALFSQHGYSIGQQCNSILLYCY